MTLPLSRAAVQRLIDPPTVRRSLSLPSRETFASVLANFQSRPRRPSSTACYFAAESPGAD